MNPVPGIDASFARLGSSFFRLASGQGHRIFIQDCWTGGYANNAGLRAVAEANLRDAQTAGLIPAIYSNANPWYSPYTSVTETIANAGAMWDAVKVVVVDAEIAGITEADIYGLALAFEALDKKVRIYTGKWFWNACGQPAWASLGRWPLWVADYDGNPAMDTLPFGPWQSIMGKQYSNVGVLGKEVDLNTFALEFFKEEDMAALTQEHLLGSLVVFAILCNRASRPLDGWLDPLPDDEWEATLRFLSSVEGVPYVFVPQPDLAIGRRWVALAAGDFRR